MRGYQYSWDNTTSVKVATFRANSFRLSKPALVAALVIGMLNGLAVVLLAHADTLNFYNGQAVNGKIVEATGDVIRYREAIGKTATVRRLSLSNRQDVVQTHANQLYSGELVYLDGNTLDIRTPSGTHRLWRGWVKNVILGTPKIQEPSRLLESNAQQHLGAKPLGNLPAPSYRKSASTSTSSRGVSRPTMPSTSDNDAEMMTTDANGAAISEPYFNSPGTYRLAPSSRATFNNSVGSTSAGTSSGQTYSRSSGSYSTRSSGSFTQPRVDFPEPLQ